MFKKSWLCLGLAQLQLVSFSSFHLLEVWGLFEVFFAEGFPGIYYFLGFLWVWGTVFGLLSDFNGFLQRSFSWLLFLENFMGIFWFLDEISVGLCHGKERVMQGKWGRDEGMKKENFRECAPLFCEVLLWLCGKWKRLLNIRCYWKHEWDL